MKGMPLPFDFEGKGVLDLEFLGKNKNFITDTDLLKRISLLDSNSYIFGEPTSILDSVRFPSMPTSSSTPSSSIGDKCGLEDSENVMLESPSQEQSILGWIMGDSEDTMGSFNKILQTPDIEQFVEQGFSGGGDQFSSNFIPSILNSPNRSGLSSNPSNSKFPVHNQNNMYPSFDSSAEMKTPIFNPQFQSQNPAFFVPLYPQQQEHNLFMPPQAKRHNLGHGGPSLIGVQPAGPNPSNQLLLHQQAIIDQLFNAAELIQAGNPLLAQEILARLNHHLSPIGKPFNRAAFYFKEALQLLLHSNHNHSNTPSPGPYSLIFKIAAYKSYSEISPLIQFANFTCNQALLDVFEGFDRIHIVDFDIGYGGQWASLMQELALRPGGPPSIKITALASLATHDQLELSLTRENLIQFASEINIGFEFDILSVDSLNACSWSLPFRPSDDEAMAVNLPVGSLANYQISGHLVLRFVKQLSPRIVVSVDRGCDRTDLPFANHVIHALQSYSNLFESLDAVNMNVDGLQKIERFLLQPGIERIVVSRFRSPEKIQHWRNLFLSSGFSPVVFSNFTESQAECVVKRTPVRGFQVEKRQSSLVLCWQRKELISASAWRC